MFQCDSNCALTLTQIKHSHSKHLSLSNLTFKSSSHSWLILIRFAASPSPSKTLWSGGNPWTFRSPFAMTFPFDASTKHHLSTIDPLYVGKETLCSSHMEWAPTVKVSRTRDTWTQRGVHNIHNRFIAWEKSYITSSIKNLLKFKFKSI